MHAKNGSAGKQKILSLDGDGVMYWPTSVSHSV